jgi:hypothetical protein
MIHTSKTPPVVTETSPAEKVSSWIEISETIDEVLIRLTNCPASGGRMRRKACGRTMRRSRRRGPRPRLRPA